MRVRPGQRLRQQRLLDAALARPGEHLWLFSSSEALGHLAAAAPRADWRGAAAIATHPRIAASARAVGIGRVCECRPEFDAVVACIQSFATSRAP